MSRTEFVIRPIHINGRLIRRVIVDEHVWQHRDITEKIVLDLVAMLDGEDQRPDDVKEPYEYFYSLLELNGKLYRLVWLLEKGKIYIGVLTAYRDDRRR